MTTLYRIASAFLLATLWSFGAVALTSCDALVGPDSGTSASAQKDSTPSEIAESAEAEPATPAAETPSAASQPKSVLEQMKEDLTGGETADPAPGAVGPDAPEHARRYAELEALYAKVPSSFKGIRGEALQQLTQDVQTLRDRLESFVADHGDTPEGCRARVRLVRLLLYLSQVHQHRLRLEEKLEVDALRERMKAYYARASSLASTFLECAPEEHPLRALGLHLHADSNFYRGELGDRDAFVTALESYKKVLKNYPDYEEIRTVRLTAGNVMSQLRDAEEGVPYVRAQLEARPDSDHAPHYHQLLWKLHLGQGDLEKMLEHSRELQKEARQRLNGERELGADERRAWLRYYAFSGHRIGLSLLALGRAGDALQAYQEALAIIGEIGRELEEQGNSLPQDIGVYATIRIPRGIEFIEKYYGQKPTVNFEEFFWATDRKVTLQKDRGKAVILTVRPYNWRRDHGFLQTIDEVSRENRDRIAPMILTWMQGKTRGVEEQRATMLDEAAALGLTNTAIAADATDDKRLIKELGTTYGSGRLFIFGPRGTYAFFMHDVRPIDAQLAIAIAERLLEEEN